MPRCAAHKPDGTPCERIVGASQRYCFAHDPSKADARSKNASRAARSKPRRELADVKDKLRELADAVMAGDADRADAAVAGQLYGTYIRAVSVEVKLKETLELEERIEMLELARAQGRWP
jgi:hypothetical protein